MNKARELLQNLTFDYQAHINSIEDGFEKLQGRQKDIDNLEKTRYFCFYLKILVKKASTLNSF